MTVRIGGLPPAALAAICLAMAAVWWRWWPRRAVSGPRWRVLRYGHAVTWLLLAAGAGLVDVAGAAARVALIGAGLTYAVFLAVLVTTPR